MWMMSIARAAVALLSLTVVPAAAKPTAEQLAYAATFADVGAGTKPAALPAAHFAASRDVSHAAADLHKGSRAAEKHFSAAAAGFVEATTASLHDVHAAVHGTPGKDVTSHANTLRPVNDKDAGARDSADAAVAGADSAYTKAIAKTYHSSLLEVASKTSAKAGVTGAASGCEVCVYVVENKQMHQPFLCRGLKDPAYQQTVSILRTGTRKNAKQSPPPPPPSY